MARGLVISGALILLLPVLLGADFLWFAMPITELLVMLYAAASMKKYTNALPNGLWAGVLLSKRSSEKFSGLLRYSSSSSGMFSAHSGISGSVSG